MVPKELEPENSLRRKLLAGGVFFIGNTIIKHTIPLPLLVDQGREKKEKLEAYNPSASMVNLSAIPSDLYKHTNSEPVCRKIDFGNTFDPNQPEMLADDMEIYGQGVREAIARGQEVFLVVEMPGKTSEGVSAQSWQKYITAIAQRWKGANFIIGNENNLYVDNHWHKPPVYADLYLDASEIIRQVSPGSLIFPYGEAYTGHGEILKETLRQISQKSHGMPLIDGLAFHYYDVASPLPERVRMYKQISGEFRLPAGLYLTELGKKEPEPGESGFVTREEHSEIVTQNLATALALKDITKTFWHTAYDPKDFNYHSLCRYDLSGNLYKKPAFDKFWEVSKALHHGVTLERVGERTFVRGYSSEGMETTIFWDSNLSKTNPAVEGRPTRNLKW